MLHRPLGSDELDVICTNCGWPLVPTCSMLGEGEGYFDHPEYGQVHIWLLMKRDLKYSHITGRYGEDFVIEINTSVYNRMIEPLVPEFWEHLEAVTPSEIGWERGCEVTDQGIHLWTRVNRSDFETAKTRLAQMYQWKERLEKAMNMATVQFSQTLLNALETETA
jgi:hypothetical protein